MDYALYIANDKDFLPMRTSYKLNLRGPSIAVQTACSTSLVAVHMACQALLTYQCDIALAGGVAINVPTRSGYLYRHGMILSPDGRCRTFDAEAQGTVVGNGAGVVVLRRLEDALDSGDHIDAVIRGSAVSNDGSGKLGFTAPGVDGQAQTIAQALAVAETDPETVTYVEAHGTGTRLGDPIEIAALTKAFRARSHGDRKGWCALGSVKPNVGHLDVAAGVTSLIKVVQALRHRQLPPSLHFKTPNPEIDFARSPFYVNTALADWAPDNERPSSARRAGVSSFGIGGTNAHVIVEEAPHVGTAPDGRPWQLLLLSARTRAALDAITNKLVQHLNDNPDVSLPDVAFTLQVGRKTFPHRRMLVCSDAEDAVTLLSTLGERRVLAHVEESVDRPIVFMFSGQGTQYVGMAREIYEQEPTFCACVDLCAGLLQPELGLDLRDVLYPPLAREAEAAELLLQTWLAQAALFVVEYALATLWMEWGIRPAAMIGHSLGEYVAACLAGVFSLEDALKIVARRGKLMQAMPPGAMLSVPLGEDKVAPLLGDALSLAAVNGPSSCVVSGPVDAVEALSDRLFDEHGVECQRLQTSHAFHSAMMDPMLDQFTAVVGRARRSAPKIPVMSNVTGAWLSPSEAQSPEYWARHLRETVRFMAGLTEVLADPARALLELGPGHVLTTLARQHPALGNRRVMVPSIRHAHHRQSDIGFLLETVGKLWLSGVNIDWSGFYTHGPRRRVPLPTYPFERMRFWIDPPQLSTAVATRPSRGAQEPVTQLRLPAWRRSVLSGSVKTSVRRPGARCCIVFADSHGIGTRMEMRLRRDGHDVFTARPGAAFAPESDNAFTIDPSSPGDFAALLGAIREKGRVPAMIMFLWGVTPPSRGSLDRRRVEDAQVLGFHSLMALARALGDAASRDEVRIGVVTSAMQKVADAAVLCPEKATLLGPCEAIPKEYPNIACISIDIDLPEPRTLQEGRLIDQLLAEVTLERTEPVIAYRNGERWVRTFEPVRIDRPEGVPPRVREEGVYLVVGGLGFVGSTLAQHLAKIARAKLVLAGRTPLPPREAWGDLLAGGEDGSRDDLRRKIGAVLEMERLGAEVLLVTADVTRSEDMVRVVAQTLERFGRLDGAIHAAGTSGVELIQHTTREGAEAILAPKLLGALVLDEALRNLRPDFVVLCASRTPVAGAARRASQCAANAFLDAFAQRRAAGDGPLTMTIDWDPWQLPDAPRSGAPEDGAGSSSEATPAVAGLSRDEALDAWMRILASPTPHIMVVKRDGQPKQQRPPSSSIVPPSKEKDAESESIPKSVHPRPNLGTAYVAPRDPLERAIAETWQNLFGIERIGAHDDFFALGGDSLLAVQLISKLRSVVNMDLPGHSLLNAPTVAALAELIAQSDSPSSTTMTRHRPARLLPASLVLIKSGTERPLFLMHPVGGHVYFYHDLATCLDAAQPVYGLQAQGIEGKAPPLTRVEEMAARYLETVRHVQPEGPYLLGGSSFGGVVAFEMAHQLLSGGQRVALLTMMDTPAPSAVPNMALDSPERLAYLISGDASLSAPAEELQRLSPDEQLLHVLRRKRGGSRMVPKLALQELATFRKIVTANLQAMLSYVAPRYPGEVLYFQASERDALSVDNPARGWSELVQGGLIVRDVPGNHITMSFPPNVQVMADHLRAAISAIRHED
jgi:phthiocerol/phenolphthiocerol synthesis type-I polyketide synthase E